MKMNKNHKMAMALVAIAVPLIAISAGLNTATSSDQQPPSIGINFSVYPANETIVVERGKPTEIPLKVEGPNNVTSTLQIRAVFDRGNVNAEQLQVALSNPSLALSSQDLANGKAIALGKGGAVWDAGTLTLKAAKTLSPGTYTFALEAEQQADGELADKLVSGTIVTVTVK